ncbi:MAG: DNA double-strand break repair nuclease NurA [Chloroflexota bacterium]|jgi:hypothetical protein
MLYPNKVQRALEAKLPEFLQFEAQHAQALRGYREWLSQLEAMPATEIDARLENLADAPGALPSEEHGSPLVVPFGLSWSNHEEARAWAFDRIQGITTLAVDGSQIAPNKDYSFGIAAIQVAWFENRHSRDARDYVKDAEFELLPLSLPTERGDDRDNPELDVNLRRFQAEVSQIVRHMEQWERTDPPPVVFFDGTLVASFAGPLAPRTREKYFESVMLMLRASRDKRVPLVGFVDTSHAKDLSTLLRHLGNLPRTDRINDAHLLRGRMRWGDRTRAFICARDDTLRNYVWGEDDFRRDIAFLYLQTTGDGPPARLDIPRWVVQEGLVDYVADVVRCEVIAGTGYPYCFEAVDAAAVLSMQDRELFYSQLQAFCERNGMRLRLAPKATSKRRRRV